jgi:hypothetical protein
MLAVSLNIRAAASCDVCDALIDDESTKRDALETALFGADRYAACIVCRRVVLQPWTPEYRLKWDKRQAQLVDEVTRPLRAAWANGMLAAQGGETFSVCALPVGAERDAWVEGWLFITKGGGAPDSRGAFDRWFAHRAKPQRRR